MMQINSRWTWRLQHTKEKSLIRKFPMTFRFFRGRETGFRQASMIQQGCNGVGHLIDPWPPLLKIKVYDVAFHHHRWSFATYHANRTTCTFDEIVDNDYSRLRGPCLNIWYFIGRVGNDQLSTCVSDECSDLNVWLSEIKKYFVIDKNERSEEENKTSNERKNSWERRSARGKGKEKIVQKVNFYLWKCFGWVMCVW